nr:MAG TPA: hypothetical protein [Caudoviricetes sp.]
MTGEYIDISKKSGTKNATFLLHFQILSSSLQCETLIRCFLSRRVRLTLTRIAGFFYAHI